MSSFKREGRDVRTTKYAGYLLGLTGGLVLLLSALAAAEPAWAQTQGCQPQLGGRAGAEVSAQLLAASGGERAPISQPSTEMEARSGQTIRLLVKPLEGPARPSGSDCPVRLNVSRLAPISRQLTNSGFVFEGGRAYGQFRPGEERTLDFELKQFDEWASPATRVEIENLTIHLPESAEFVARLPAPLQPPPGTVCAHVVYTDAQPAVGVVLALSAPLDGPTDRRPVGADGQVCWEGFDEMLFGDLSLDAPTEAALGQPKSRYVSYEASYRLFVARRPR